MKDPQNPSILYNIGNTYYKTGNFAAAEEHYAQALATAPPALKPKLLYNMGNSAYRQGHLKEAVAHYQDALELSREDIQAKENLAFVQQQLQKQQQQQKDPNANDQKDRADQQEGKFQDDNPDPAGRQQPTQKDSGQPKKRLHRNTGPVPPKAGNRTKRSTRIKPAGSSRSRPGPGPETARLNRNRRPPRCSTGSRISPAGP